MFPFNSYPSTAISGHALTSQSAEPDPMPSSATDYNMEIADTTIQVPPQHQSSGDTAELELVSKDDFKRAQQKKANQMNKVRKQNKKLARSKRQLTADLYNVQNELAASQREIQEHEKYHLGLYSAYEGLNTAIEGLQKELLDSEQEIQNLNGLLASTDNADKQMEVLHKDLATSQRDLEAYKNEAIRLQNVDRDLQYERKELSVTQQSLQECMDDLFSYQPISQVADTEILRDFQDINRYIVKWIDAESDAFEEAHPEARPGHIFSIGEDKDATQFLKKHPDAGEQVVRCIIHCYLQGYFFSKNTYLLGLSSENVRLLRRTEKAMADLKPLGESAKIASWRSETLRAIDSTEECRNLKKEQIQNIKTKIFQSLSDTFPILFRPGGGEARFYKQVTLPASNLASKIWLSTSDYVFSMVKHPFCKYKPLTLEDFKAAEYVDIQTSKTLKPDSPVIADDKGICGTIIIAMEPGLYRLSKGSKDIPLRQAKYLVKLTHPLGKRNRAPA